DGRLPATDRRLPEAPIPAYHPADAVQLSRRYPGKVARYQISLHSTLPLRLPGESRRRVRRPVRPPRLDQPQSLRHPVAPSHRRMVLYLFWPHPRRSDRRAKVRRIVPSSMNLMIGYPAVPAGRIRLVLNSAISVECFRNMVIRLLVNSAMTLGNSTGDLIVASL